MTETKEKILLKALQYFTENDYEGASLEKIAGAIGITKGGIYHYFKSKDELFRECMIYFFSAISDISKTMITDEMPLKDLLKGIFSFEELFYVIADMFRIDLLKDYFNYAYLMFVGIKKFPDIRGMVGEIYSSMQEDLRKIFTDFQRKGEIKESVDCSLLAFELVAMIEGTILVTSFNKMVNFEELGEQLADKFYRDIAAE